MFLSIVLAIAAPSEQLPDKPFPDPMPSMMEACLTDAVSRKNVSKEKDAWKYICANEPAQALWNHLEKLNVDSWEQTVSNGTWLSRAFPLGGCFRQMKDTAGESATTDLSCTLWIPR